MGVVEGDMSTKLRGEVVEVIAEDWVERKSEG